MKLHFHAATIAICSGLLYTTVLAQPSLLVCSPGNANSQQIQQGYEAILGTGKALAFARIKDLEGLMTTSPNAAIIAPALFFEMTSGYKELLQGKVGNESGQKYYVITASAEVTKDNVSSKKVGILDFLGRERLPAFIKKAFGFEPSVLKRANKTEDLLAMLGMETVDAIIISASEMKEIKARTKLTLTVVAESSCSAGFLALATPASQDGDNIKKTVLKQPVGLTQALGIDRWEAK